MAMVKRYDLSTGGAIPDSTSAEMPAGATVLSAAWVDGRVCVYTLGDDFEGVPKQKRHFRIFATDEPFQWAEGMRYVGAVHALFPNRGLAAVRVSVYHVFEEVDA